MDLGFSADSEIFFCFVFAFLFDLHFKLRKLKHFHSRHLTAYMVSTRPVPVSEMHFPGEIYLLIFLRS